VNNGKTALPDNNMPSTTPFRASIIIPAFNEAATITHTVSVIKEVIQQCTDSLELIIVDDGSSDETFDKVAQMAATNKQLKGIRFSRNFGKESAILAGLKAADGDIAITIDADLQHPPTLIPAMIDKWKQGARVVHAVKNDRSNDTAIARFRASLFNHLLEKMGGIETRNSSDFKLLDRIAVDILVKELPERGRFYRGLSNWIGFKQANVLFDVAPRSGGESKWSMLSLAGLAITAIVSFTSAPLRIVTVLGFVTLAFGLLVGIDTLWSWSLGEAISGFATIIITILILGSFTMISLGIIGEYIAKIYNEIKSRPTYLIESVAGFDITITTTNADN